MAASPIYVWRGIPFLRILLSLITGILIQWNYQIPVKFVWYALAAFFVLLICLFFVSVFDRYRLYYLNGLAICMLFIAIGALLIWNKDIRHENQWIGYLYEKTDKLIVDLNEPLVAKSKSYKAEATIKAIWRNENMIPAKGKVIIYFKKDSAAKELEYGSQLMINKPIQEIKNSGNPGGFDFKRYSLFNGITHQAYLNSEDYTVLPGKNEKWLNKFLNKTSKKVLQIIQTNIKGDKESGLAEALLIGYKNDLDKNLVQSYTNTGVVHIIAISGLHLGLIYWLLLLLFKPLKKQKYFKWLRPILIISVLWLFALLTGAQPSILRSAVMFTCIVIGEGFFKKGNIFNTLAFSAFILLCWNPFWLWDVGFQLSYSAVLSIIIFMRPIYNWFYIKNRILDFFWKLNAVTLAAQILTLPVSIYHFHQFPTFFLLTNFVAVPLSSIILIGEIFLCLTSPIPFIALWLGKILSWFIWLMNSYIEKIEALPYSLWDGLQVNILQAIFLTIIAACLGYWLMEKSSKGLKAALLGLLGFALLRSVSFINTGNQKKIIVYNVPRQRAIDFINGNEYFFEGDPHLIKDDFARNFHLKPSRILHRIEPADSINDLIIDKNFISYKEKKILLIDGNINFEQPVDKPDIDLIVISNNPRIKLDGISRSFHIGKIVFDGSVPSWKVLQWKKECDTLHIPYHDVNEKGAFVMNLR